MNPSLPTPTTTTTTSSISAIDEAASVRRVQQFLGEKKIADWKHSERLREAAARQKRRRDESEDEEDDDEEEEEEDINSLEERTRRQVKQRMLTHTSETTTPTSITNPLDLLRQPTTAAPIKLTTSQTIIPNMESWSSELSAATHQADAVADEIDWETDEPAPASNSLPSYERQGSTSATQPLDDMDDEDGYQANDEVLFGEEDEDDTNHLAAAAESFESSQPKSQPSPAAVPQVDPSFSLNKISLPSSAAPPLTPQSSPPPATSPSLAKDATSAAAASLAAQEGAFTISFEALTKEQIAAQVKQKKAEAKSQKQEAKAKKDAAKATKGGPRKRKSAGESASDLDSGQKKTASQNEDNEDVEPKPKKKRATTLVPAQRMTKAARDLLTHIHHVHLLSLLELIQIQSSPNQAIGIMTDPLLSARLLSIVLNKCPNAQMKQWKIDPRKASTWIGANSKKPSSTSAASTGITWKSSHRSPEAAASSTTQTTPSPPPVHLGVVSGPLGPPIPAQSSYLPPAAHGTIFDRVQKLAYWFRSHFNCSSDRITMPINDKSHPLHSYDTNMHVRMLNTLRCTCVRRRLIHAGVKKLGLTNPWYHYKQCCLHQLNHILDTREGGYQQLTMLFVMILRQMNVLARLCYGIPAVNYKKDLVFPKADNNELNQSLLVGLDELADQSFGGHSGKSATDASSIMTQLLREQAAQKQDPNAIKILDSAVRETCQCQKPFQPTSALGSPTKAGSASRDPTTISSQTALPKTESSPPPATTTTDAATTSTVTPRKTAAFLKQEAIDLLSSSEEEEAEVQINRSPHFTKKKSSASATTVTAPSSTTTIDLNYDDDFLETPEKVVAPSARVSKKSSTAKKLDVEPSTKKSATLTKSKSEPAASASSTTKSTPRTSKNKKINYVESDDDDESGADEGDEEDGNPCLVCGALNSTDEKNNPIMLCDGCDSATCFKCAQPPLTELPEEFYCSRCVSQPKKRRASSSTKAKKRSPAKKDKDSDGDIEMLDVDDVQPSSSTKKKARVPRKPRPPKSATAIDADIDLTNSNPSSPSSSTKSKKTPAKGRPKLTKAKTAPAPSTPKANAAPSTAASIATELSDLSDSSFDHRPAAAASSTRKSTSSSAAKLPKRKYFEHGYPLIWCEFYCPEEKRWIHVDVLRHLFDSEGVYEHDGGISFQYVIAVRPSEDGHRHLLTDVTKRYVRKWSSIAGNRADEGWFKHHLQRLSGGCAAIDRDLEQADQTELDQRHTEHDNMPTRLNEFKNHPLYCIEKFLLKFEMIYPSGQQHSKGVFIEKKKPNPDGTPVPDIIHLVYPRTSLHQLHTLDRWRREQRAVKQDEVPYPVKVVKKLSQMSRAQREEKIRLGLIDPEGEKSTLYGLWQTEPWMPEAAQNGIVPKNERGHVDVWNDSHIPPGCVHLPHPRLKAVCKRLEIDYADAMTGFDVKGGRSVPRFEGVVICAEYEDRVMQLYHEMESAATERAEKRRLTAIVKNWKRLVRGSIVREKVMREVMTKGENTEQAFVPAAAAAAAATSSATTTTPTKPSTTSASTDLSSTGYGALADTLHASATSTATGGVNTHPSLQPHTHQYSQRSFDVASNSWISRCHICGEQQ